MLFCDLGQGIPLSNGFLQPISGQLQATQIPRAVEKAQITRCPRLEGVIAAEVSHSTDVRCCAGKIVFISGGTGSLGPGQKSQRFCCRFQPECRGLVRAELRRGEIQFVGHVWRIPAGVHVSYRPGRAGSNAQPGVHPFGNALHVFRIQSGREQKIGQGAGVHLSAKPETVVPHFQFGSHLTMVGPQPVVGENHRHNATVPAKRVKKTLPGPVSVAHFELPPKKGVRRLRIVPQSSPEFVPEPVSLRHPVEKSFVRAIAAVQKVGNWIVGRHGFHGVPGGAAEGEAVYRPPDEIRVSPAKHPVGSVGPHLPDNLERLGRTAIVFKGIAGGQIAFNGTRDSLVRESQLLPVVFGFHKEMSRKLPSHCTEFFRIRPPRARVHI